MLRALPRRIRSMFRRARGSRSPRETRLVEERDLDLLCWFLLGRELRANERERYRKGWVGQRGLGELCTELLDSREFEAHTRRHALSLDNAAKAPGSSYNLTSEVDVFFAYRLLLSRCPDPSGWDNYRTARDTPALVSALLCSPEFRSTPMYRAMSRDESSDVELIDAGGFRLAVSPHDLTNRDLFVRGSYEPHVTRALRKALRPGMVVCDVGANIGYYTNLAASLVGPAGRVVAFETRAENAQQIRRSVVANGFANVIVLPVALAERWSLFRYLRAEGTNGYLVALEPGERVIAGNAEDITQALPLDDLPHLFPRLDVIKIDIEGAEGLALRGARRVLEAHRPLILTELSPVQLARTSMMSGADYLSLLTELGYELEILNPGGGRFGKRINDLLNRVTEMSAPHVDVYCHPARSS